MKKSIFIVLLIIILVSCNSKKKEIKHVEKKPPVLMDSAQITQKIKPDTISQKQNNEVQNILTQKENETSNSIKSISDLWKSYKSSKAKANKFIASGNLDSIIYYLNIAANSAYDLSREDIATWQLNNIGYYSINRFKKLTDYDTRMQELATMNNLKKKGIYLKETKTVFKENFEILSAAQNYLYKAQLMDSELEKSERTNAIERNLQFIEWIDNFISGNKQIIKRK